MTNIDNTHMCRLVVFTPDLELAEKIYTAAHRLIKDCSVEYAEEFEKHCPHYNPEHKQQKKTKYDDVIRFQRLAKRTFTRPNGCKVLVLHPI